MRDAPREIFNRRLLPTEYFRVQSSPSATTAKRISPDESIVGANSTRHWRLEVKSRVT